MAVILTSTLIPGEPAVIDFPSVTVVGPVSNPCDPRAPVTVNYTLAGGTAGSTIHLMAYGDDGVDGPGTLLYSGFPATNTPTESCPCGQYGISAQSDNGTSGSFTVTPTAGFYWPGSTCTWRAVYVSSADISDSYDDTQVIDTSLIPVPDTTGPVVTFVDPVNLGTHDAEDPVTLTITDAAGLGFNPSISILNAYGHYEVVTFDDTTFYAGYITNSTATPITNGYLYSLKRTTNWAPGTLNIRVVVYDTTGNITEASASSTVPGVFTVADVIDMRQNGADVRAGDDGSVFGYKLRTFDHDIPSNTGKTLRVRYSVNGAAYEEMYGQFDAGYASTGQVYFQFPDGTLDSPGNVRVELALVSGSGDAVTYPVDDTLYIFVAQAL